MKDARKKNLKRKQVIMFIAVMMLLVMTVGVTLFAGTPEAVTDQQTYALVVQTGTKDGEHIGTFIVEYEDTSGNYRRAYINPHDGDFTGSLKFAAKAVSSEDREYIRQENVYNTFGYRAAWWKCGGSSFENYKALSSYSTDTYFFDTYSPLKNIRSISVLTELSDIEKCDWDCYGMSVYSVSQINGLGMSGYVSDQFYVKFKGELKAELQYKSKNTGNPMRFDFVKKGIQTITTKELKVGTDTTKIANVETVSLVTDSSRFKKSVQFDNTTSDTYYFNIAVSDLYKAGLEQYMAGDSATSVKDLKMAETMILDVFYYDTAGARRHVASPVVISYLANAMEKEIITADTKLAAVVAQGENIAVPMELPDIDLDKSFQRGDVKLKFVNKEADASTTVVDMKYTCGMYSGYRTEHDKVYDRIQAQKDVIVYSGIQVYGAESKVQMSLVNNAYIHTTWGNEKPILNEVADSKRGITLTIGKQNTLDLKKYDGQPLAPDSQKANYLFAIQTGNQVRAGTTSKVELVIFYKNKKGEELQKSLELSEACRDFYGYWPDQNGNDRCYEFNMMPNGTLYVPVYIENVNYFTGTRLELQGRDDWIVAGISAYSVTTMGNINYAWTKSAIGNDKMKTCMVAYRKIDGWAMVSQEDQVDQTKATDAAIKKGQTPSDVNKDTNGDGKPDVNIDTDGDGKPDKNIDTDGDGKPDKNIDTNGDGKPDVNVDTDGDGKPDVNVDTDGDGKPDKNIDTDGDGKPDKDIDPKAEAKLPAINVDTDGDGKSDQPGTGGSGSTGGKTPDINIDFTSKDSGNGNGQLLSQSGSDFNSGELEISFTSGKVQKKRNKIDLFDYMYNMSYDKATDYLGFHESAIQYAVKVAVASSTQLQATDTVTNENPNNNDDCGSENYFYFQLIFENGTSAFVQANQQLPSDGFRTGTIAEFTISVNRDYGGVQAIYVIPETDPDYGHPYDKLKIDNITVSRRNANGLSENYVFDSIGWIGFDYQQESVKGKTHTKGEIAQCYTVSKVTTGVEVMFSISYDAQELEAAVAEANNNTVKVEDKSPFIGNIYATIHYKPLGEGGMVDDKLSLTKTDIEVGQRLYEFNDTQSKIVKTDGETSYVETDPNTMVRGGHTDRFLWTATDVQYITGIELFYQNRSGDKVTINVASVTAQVISNADSLRRQMNKAGEVILVDEETNMTPTFTNLGEWVSSSQNKGIIEVVTGDSNSKMFEFSNVDKEAIVNLRTKNSTPYTVKRAPNSRGDEYNVFVYTGDNQTQNVETSLKVNINYTDIYGNYNEGFAPPIMNTPILVDEQRGRYVFYAMSVDAPNMAVLNSVHVEQSKTSSTINNLAIDYIMVQHIRQGTVIGNYLCNYAVSPVLASTNPTTLSVRKLSAGDSVKQEVTIKLTDDVKHQVLVPETFDLAVAIQYESEFAPDASDTTSTKTYYTAYRFLSDFGYTSVDPGGIYTLDFNEFGVGKIVGVKLAATSSLDIAFDYMSVGCYTGMNPMTDKDGNTTYTYNLDTDEWYTCKTTVENNSLRNNAKLYTMSKGNRDSANTISPITFTFDVMERHDVVSDVGLSNQGSLDMLIRYKDVFGNEQTRRINGIEKQLASGSFRAGDRAVFRYMAEGIPGASQDAITSIVLLPYDNDGKLETKEKLGIDSLSIDYGGGYTYENVSLKMEYVWIERTEAEQADYYKMAENTIYTNDYTLTADVYQLVGEKSETRDTLCKLSSLDKKEETIELEDKKKVYLNVSSEGAYQMIVNGSTDFTVTKNADGSYVIQYVNTNSNVAGTTVSQSIKLISSENPNVKLVLNVKVSIPAPPKQPDESDNTQGTGDKKTEESTQTGDKKTEESTQTGESDKKGESDPTDENNPSDHENEA